MTTARKIHPHKLLKNALLGILLIAGATTTGYSNEIAKKHHSQKAHTTKHGGQTHKQGSDRCKTPPVTVNCGSAPSGVFDSGGFFWVAFEFNQHIYVSHSTDLGKTYSPAVMVNPEPEKIYARGENRPKIAIGNKGEIYISWTKKTQGRFNGDIRFSRSLNNGQSFEPVKTINDDGLTTGHRFDSLLLDDNNHIYLSWIDKRDRLAHNKKGGKYKGAAIYYSVSTDGGNSFSTNYKLADNSCECCRMSISTNKGGGAALFWRHIFGNNTRDHAFAIINTNGTVATAPQRATRDNWQIDACPHHGPSMILDNKQSYHMTWFTNSDTRKGVYYGRFNQGSGQMENIRNMTQTPGAGHPFLLQHTDSRLYLAWKAFDGEKTQIHLATSNNRGTDWQQSKVIAQTDGASDHPFLQLYDGSAYLVWQTELEGMRLQPITSVTATKK